MTVDTSSLLRVKNQAESPLMMLMRGDFGNLFRLHYALVLFAIIFVLPTFSALFYVTVSSGRYGSEDQFIVRGVSSSQVGALSSLLRTFGISRSNDDSYAVENYIVSRDALRHLNDKTNVTEIYTLPEADFITRLYPKAGEGQFETLFRYYQDQVEVIRNFETGITTLKVSAYRPEDAETIARTLLSLGEARVNEMNIRSRQDLLVVTERGLKEAEARLMEIQLLLTRFRVRELNVDLEKAAIGRVELVTSLLTELASEEVKLRQMESGAPSNPAISAQKSVVEALRRQVAIEQGKIAGTDTGLASQLASYEALLLEKNMAEKAYETATHSLNQAQEEARRKQIYLEPIVSPSLPDEAIEPRRLRTLFTTALLSFASFVMIYLLVSGSREHLNLH